MDLESFSHKILPLKNTLMSHAKRYLADEQEVEDVVQETFLKLWELKDNLEKHPNLTGYSIQIVKNLCINQLNSKSKFDSIENATILNERTEISTGVETKDELQEILRIIDTFPSLQKKIFRMKHIEGYEVEEIASIMQCSKESVRMHISRGRRKINEIYTKNQRYEK